MNFLLLIFQFLKKTTQFVGTKIYFGANIPLFSNLYASLKNIGIYYSDAVMPLLETSQYIFPNLYAFIYFILNYSYEGWIIITQIGGFIVYYIVTWAQVWYDYQPSRAIMVSIITHMLFLLLCYKGILPAHHIVLTEVENHHMWYWTVEPEFFDIYDTTPPPVSEDGQYHVRHQIVTEEQFEKIKQEKTVLNHFQWLGALVFISLVGAQPILWIVDWIMDEIFK